MIAFNQLKPLHDSLADEIAAAMRRVADSGWYILGPEVEAFEREFADFHGVAHAIGVASGTDAIELALRAAGIGKGDEVISVAHTALATVTAIERDWRDAGSCRYRPADFHARPKTSRTRHQQPHARHLASAPLRSTCRYACVEVDRRRARTLPH